MASGEDKDPYFFPVWNSFYVTFPNNDYNLSHHCIKVIKPPPTQPYIKREEITDLRQEILHVSFQTLALYCLPSLLLHLFVASLNCNLFSEIPFRNPSVKYLGHASST